MAEAEVCERDGVATRLRCARCEVRICPACLVRTPVGHKCPACAGPPVAARRRGRAGLLMATGVAVAGLLAAALVARSPDDPPAELPADPVAAETARPSAQAMIGEEVRDGQLAFVVEELDCAPMLCTLRFTVRNDSRSPALLLGRFQYLVDGQARRHGPHEALTGRSLGEINVNPGVVLPLAFVYELPESAEPVEARFRGTGSSRFGISVLLRRR